MQALTDDRGRKWRKAGLGAVIGAVFGFAGAYTVLSFADRGALGELGESQVVALLVALVYLLMGVAVGFGALSPRLGAQFLNVEDADELREERALLGPSAIGTILLSLALAALALAGNGGPVSPAAAGVAIVLALASSVWLSLHSTRKADELMRAVMRDSGAASFYLAFLALGGWAALAHLELAPQPTALDIVTVFYAVTLIGCFWVIGRRGMMLR